MVDPRAVEKMKESSGIAVDPHRSRIFQVSHGYELALKVDEDVLEQLCYAEDSMGRFVRGLRHGECDDKFVLRRIGFLNKAM